MPAVVGIDLSSKAIDLVKLDENTSKANWTHIDMLGARAWDRILAFNPEIVLAGFGYWEDVYLVAIEAPYGRGQSGTLAILNRVVGAVAASLPRELRVPERCWLVAPHEWKAGLGIKGKPTPDDLARISNGETGESRLYDEQDARDAYCLAYWTREQNAKAISDQIGGDIAA